jgi:LAO/AO transport system kinase
MHLSVKEILEGLDRGKRASLARAITMLESRRPQDREHQLGLLDGFERLIAQKGHSSVRIAVTGAPGVGKSTLINQLGLWFISQGHRVAVLAIDPSSEATGGSILGDKTRMDDLSREADAFIRPSPTSGHLGGVAIATRQAILACEVAGFDRIIVETVGVGQSEYQVRHLADAVLLVTIAGAGDGLQGIKRGILESVDLVAVNKADGERREWAENHARELSGALNLLRGHDSPLCIPTSAISAHGVQSLFARLDDVVHGMHESGKFESQRQTQRIRWFNETIRHLVDLELKQRASWNEHEKKLRDQVEDGTTTPFRAAAALIDTLFGR